MSKYCFNMSPNDMQKGILYMVGGTLILLYAFNFFQRWLNGMVIVGAIAMILYGFFKIGGVQKIQQWTKKEDKKGS